VRSGWDRDVVSCRVFPYSWPVGSGPLDIERWRMLGRGEFGPGPLPPGEPTTIPLPTDWVGLLPRVVPASPSTWTRPHEDATPVLGREWAWQAASRLRWGHPPLRPSIAMFGMEFRPPSPSHGCPCGRLHADDRIPPAVVQAGWIRSHRGYPSHEKGEE